MRINAWFRSAVVVVLCCLLFANCGGDPHLRLVCVVDLSSSIEPEARAEAFAALQAIFAEHRLQRGDSLIIIPVTGDMTTEAQGRVLRFEVSERRSAYDSDLKRLAAEVGRAVSSLQGDAAARPASHSDVIGAVNMALEELGRGARQGDSRDYSRAVVILSDLVNDTPGCNFVSSPQLASAEAARRYAASLSGGRAHAPEGTSVYLGLLRSTDLRRIPQARRDAIQAFWDEYVRGVGASSVSLVVDGPRQLTEATRANRRSTP